MPAQRNTETAQVNTGAVQVNTPTVQVKTQALQVSAMLERVNTGTEQVKTWAVRVNTKAALEILWQDCPIPTRDTETECATLDEALTHWGVRELVLKEMEQAGRSRFDRFGISLEP